VRDHLEIPPDLARMAEVRRYATVLLARSGVVGRTADEVLLALSELVQNAVEHGDKARSGRIRIRLAVADGSVRIEVEDPTTDPDAARCLAEAFSRATAPPAQEEERGRGLFLVSTLLDRVEVVPLPVGGVLVRGEKRIPSGPS
jgi:anti-sigma regulatory factor (Ser/Thr protein kinase)